LPPTRPMRRPNKPGGVNAACSPGEPLSRLLLDEMFSCAIASQLRAKGHDLVAVVTDPALAGLADEVAVMHSYPPARMAWRRVTSSGLASSSPARARLSPTRRGRHLLGVLVLVRRGTRRRRAPGRGAAGVREGAHLRQPRGPACRADQPRRTAARELPPGADPPGADQRRVQPRPCPRRVNRQDLAMTDHLPGGEARFVAKGSHGHEGAPGNTRRSEPR
jgi:hypothetical protein